MVLEAARIAQTGTAAGAIRSLVQSEGTAVHRYAHARAIWSGATATADMSDVVHTVCMLHGHQPGVIDFACARLAGGPAADWIETAVHGFKIERALLARIAAQAGPVPSTPGQSASEAAVTGQRHAIEMLAQSDRTGCAAGAAAALLFDWEAIRAVLDQAAERLGIDLVRSELPSPTETEAAITAIGQTAGIERALMFGAQQMVMQQRALWDLLEARHSARSSG